MILKEEQKNIRFNRIGFTSSMKSVLVTTVFSVRTCSTVGNKDLTQRGRGSANDDGSEK